MNFFVVPKSSQIEVLLYITYHLTEAALIPVGKWPLTIVHEPTFHILQRKKYFIQQFQWRAMYFLNENGRQKFSEEAL